MHYREPAKTIDLFAVLRPETPLEKELLCHPLIQEGMRWGVPRYGHPEGEVYKHVREVLDNVDRLTLTTRRREWLRLIALVHDTFKFREDKREPRDWRRHHAVLARRFFENYTSDTALLNIIQNHDEAYYIWRDTVIYRQSERAELRMRRLLDRIAGHEQTYYLFFKCDTQTGDKNPAPIRWVEAHFPGITPVVLSPK